MATLPYSLRLALALRLEAQAAGDPRRAEALGSLALAMCEARARFFARDAATPLDEAAGPFRELCADPGAYLGRALSPMHAHMLEVDERKRACGVAWFTYDPARAAPGTGPRLAREFGGALLRCCGEAEGEVPQARGERRRRRGRRGRGKGGSGGD